MPQRITKSRLMRSRAIATPPPICRSKGQSEYMEDGGPEDEEDGWTETNYRGLDWHQAAAIREVSSRTGFGRWSYTDKEHQIYESGSWANPVVVTTGTLKIYYEPPPQPDWNPSELIADVLSSHILDIIADRVAAGRHGRWIYVPVPSGAEQTGTF